MKNILKAIWQFCLNLFLPQWGRSQSKMEEGRYKRAGNPPFERKVTSI